jgi:hypothetical protein
MRVAYDAFSGPTTNTSGRGVTVKSGLAARTYVRYRRAVRCPYHGVQEVEEDQPQVCPVKIRRTIAGKVENGICGMPLED